jgi:hypothetical protein
MEFSVVREEGEWTGKVTSSMGVFSADTSDCGWKMDWKKYISPWKVRKVEMA